jgi:ribosomal protein S12 methylthiotransferase accessory factor
MSHALSYLLISGTSSGEALELMVADAFGSAVKFSSELSNPEANPVDLVIGVHAKGADGEARAFDAWARTAKIPALSVELGAREARIGPLSLPGRAGCGHCTRTRIAATAYSVSEDRVTADTVHDVAVIGGVVLVSELSMIVNGHLDEARLVDHILLSDAETGKTSLHRVIPLSRCSVCGGVSAWMSPPKRAVRLSAEDSLETVLEALAGWVDRRTGVISRIELELPGDTRTELPIVATAWPPYTVEEDGSLRRLPIGWGKGLVLSEAILSAVGEAIERYAASLPDPERIVWKRPDDLDGELLDPRSFALYTEAQYERRDFPYVRFDSTVPHPWVLGRWLGRDTPVWVPAVFAFLSLTICPQHHLCQGTSNGLAASTEPEEAALRATLELVERDAFMAAWLTACPGWRVAVDSAFDPQLRQVLDGIEALGAMIELYILPTSAFGTTALCLALGDGYQYPGATIGLASDLDPDAAVRHAVLELAQTGPHLRRMMRSHSLPVPDEPHQVREMLHHAAYYFPAERATAFDRLRNNKAPIALRNLVQAVPNRSLENCAVGLEAAGIRVALVDVTPPDVATGPFSAVRAVSPDLQAISYGYGFDRQPVERIRVRKLASQIPAISPIW